jgi:hypothetical protein
LNGYLGLANAIVLVPPVGLVPQGTLRHMHCCARGMELRSPHPDCGVDQVGPVLRARVGTGTKSQTQECYGAIAALALQHKFDRVLVVGAGSDAHAHLSARDAVVAFAEIGVPAGFRIAFVATSDATLNGYRHAEIEARNRGLRARVLNDETQAIAWLTEPDVH